MGADVTQLVILELLHPDRLSILSNRTVELLKAAPIPWLTQVKCDVRSLRNAEHLPAQFIT